MRKALLTATTIFVAIGSAAALAAENEDLNSGFGKDLFAGEGHPAFTDPSIHDPQKLQDIAPAAGMEKKEESGKNDEAQPAEKKGNSVPLFGTGGMTSTINPEE